MVTKQIIFLISYHLVTKTIFLVFINNQFQIFSVSFFCEISDCLGATQDLPDMENNQEKTTLLKHIYAIVFAPGSTRMQQGVRKMTRAMADL